MRKVINGKKYDTETAEEITSWHNSYSRGDFHFCQESLHRTRKGAWFLAGYGGPLSKYCEQVGNAYCSGEGLSPLSDDEARQWLESHDFVEELEEYFASSIEEA